MNRGLFAIAATAAIGASLLAGPEAHADTDVVYIGGTGTGMVPTSATVPQGFTAPFVHDVGTATNVKYNGAPWANPHAAAPKVSTIVQQQTNQTTIIGLSKGAQVARAAEQRDTRTDTRYVLIGDPDDDHGISRHFGFSPPKRAFTHDVNIVTAEYDGVGDFPDRPNYMAVMNAMAGWQQLHTQYGTGKASDPLTRLNEARVTTTTNPNGTTTTRTLIPTKHLPITQGIRNTLKRFGHTTADKVVDQMDAKLRPTIDKGYSRNDKPKASKPAKAPKTTKVSK
ncbi:hypothetical protein A5630_25450 [Mycolicibacterium mucogenicum]|uniref:PE-PPE domain-containing protein n=1 Tax=Mycolicibacterium mucogenicum TaxID=56689 RepID=A0A1A3GWU6_MYCMU|nr:PE-PPE domain-containing protein [Mycolicibacterium mucogenicum]OBJ40300.1 hypothetical protein A5630_25450 [Mycolicibacterium mucogenicum]